MFTQGDHYDDYKFSSDEDLPTIAKRLAQNGFRTGEGKKWIMPGAIVTVEQL